MKSFAPTLERLGERISPVYLVARIAPSMPVWYQTPEPMDTPDSPPDDIPMDENGNGFPPTDPYPVDNISPVVPA